MACSQKESCGNTGSPVGREPQGDPPDLREGQTGPGGKSERLIVPKNPGNLGGGKEPQFKDSARRGEGRGIGKSLPTQSKVGLLQEALHVKAKENPSYRFYSLYDKIWREDLLGEAWKRCRANDGVPGVDGVSFQQIEKTGVEPWLGELAKELKEKSYRPQALKRVWLKKPEGGERPIGIATVKDRVAQMAAVIVLEPIFEADLCEEQYGYRKGRNAHQAVQQIQKALKLGHRDVVDGDLSGYFDNIPHHELLKSVARRVSDGAMLKLIRQWLEMAVEEDDGKGGKRRTTQARDNRQGTPQGSPLSPLLSNVYMRRFILGWEKLGYRKAYAGKIVAYADDFVILCKAGAATAAREAMERIMKVMKLQVNERKTRTARVPEESFEFLGYRFGVSHSPRGKGNVIAPQPSKKAIGKITEAISAETGREHYWKPVEMLVGTLNEKLRGWKAYFQVGWCSQAYRVVDNHARHRLRQWLNGKHQSRGYVRYRHNPTYLHGKLGLIRLGR